MTRPHVRQLSIQQLDEQRNGRERVAILGSGWAGYTLSRDLDARKYQIVVVSPRSYFVFTPLLASTAVGTLEFRTALEPVRSFKGRGVGAEYFQAWADSVDLDKKVLTVEEAVGDPLQARALTAGPTSKSAQSAVVASNDSPKKKGALFDLSWDKLVITVGCYAQTFNTPGVREHAYFLKDVGDARRIRHRILSCFETAALPTTPDATRRALLNFAIVGGGPTGVEFAAELHDSVYEDMKRLYPELFPFFRITIYDVAPKVLNMFDEKLAEYAMRAFQRENIEIRTNHHVEELRVGAPGDENSSAVSQDGETSHSKNAAITPYTLKVKELGAVGVGMCVWSTGLMMNPFVANALDNKVRRDERTGGIITNDKMQILRPVTGRDADSLTSTPFAASDSVFALGDCAAIEGTAYPATAQVASQKAIWLAKRLNKGDLDRQAFKYRNLGIMAYVGNRNAIVQSAGGDISGRMAWLIWRGAYLAKSVSWRNRILIPIYWYV